MILSIVAVAMAGVAWFATRHHEPDRAPGRRPAAQQPAERARTRRTTSAEADAAQKPQKPAVDRSQGRYVEVFNNSGISGLAGRVAARRPRTPGWQVVGSDNWYGTIPASTVYYPPRLGRPATLLALDLGIHRMMPAVAPMRLDRLTVILTGPLAPAH